MWDDILRLSRYPKYQGKRSFNQLTRKLKNECFRNTLNIIAVLQTRHCIHFTVPSYDPQHWLEQENNMSSLFLWPYYQNRLSLDKWKIKTSIFLWFLYWQGDSANYYHNTALYTTSLIYGNFLPSVWFTRPTNQLTFSSYYPRGNYLKIDSYPTWNFYLQPTFLANCLTKRQ